MTKLQRFFLWTIAAFNVRSVGRYMIYGVVVGLATGAAAIAFYYLTQVSQHFFLDYLVGYRPDHPAGEPPILAPTDTPFRRYLLFFVPALGGLIVGFLVYKFAPEAGGHGTDAAIDAFHHKQGRIRARVPIVKAISSAITLGSGGSGGREGPIAQIGAGFGAFLGERLRLPARDRRILLAAGLGAGIGSIFRAPLAGALFAAEILYREPEFESEVIIPATVTTIVAYSVFGMVVGFDPLFEHSTYSFKHPLELGPYTVLAIVLALASAAYVKVFYGAERAFGRLKMPRYLKPALGGLMAGAVGYFLPETLGAGYGVVQDALNNQLAVKLLLLVAVGKILTTSFTIGSGGSAGVFGPSMVIGASLGGAIGRMFYGWIPGIVSQPGAFVIVGMAGFFAAASNAPISTIIMVSEMTGNYNLLVPAMWVVAIAYVIGRRWSIFENQVPTRADSPAHVGDFLKDVLEDIYVRDAYDRSDGLVVVPEHMALKKFIPIMTACDQHVFPVVDRDNRLTGVFDLNDVREILVERDLDNLLIIKEIVNDDIPSVTPNHNLAQVIRRFTDTELDTLPVVDPDGSGQLLGMIRRNEISRSYYERMHAMRNEP